MRVHFGVLGLVAFLSAGAVNAAPCAGFTDVEDTSQFCPYIAWMKNRAITLGCAANLYCPTQAVSRAQMAAFLSRLDAVNPAWVDAVGHRIATVHGLTASSPNSKFSQQVLWNSPVGIIAVTIGRNTGSDPSNTFYLKVPDTFFETPDCTGQAFLTVARPDGVGGIEFSDKPQFTYFVARGAAGHPWIFSQQAAPSLVPGISGSKFDEAGNCLGASSTTVLNAVDPVLDISALIVNPITIQ